MHSNNPMLSRFGDAARATAAGSRADVMTIPGTATKAFILLMVLGFSAGLVWQQVAAGRVELVTPAVMIGGIGGFIVAMVTVFKPHLAPWTAPIYASLEGLLLGAISAMFNAAYKGVPQQAVLLTIGVAAGVFLLYHSRVVRATPGFRRMLMSAMLGIVLFYVGSMILSLFGVQVSYFTSNGPLSIAINLFIVGVAAFSLVLDFDMIEQGARSGAPKAMEWYSAFSLMITLVWLYLELLRLLSRFQGNNRS